MIMEKKMFNNLTAVGLTNPGCVREHNEDNILIDQSLGLLVVADGMGGHEAGEVASMEAIKIIQQMLNMLNREITKRNPVSRLFSNLRTDDSDVNEKEQYLEEALHQANRHVYQLNLQRNADDGTGMGTTIAGCWIVSDDTMLVFHVGDSRVYRFRNQKLEGLTKDHSVLQEWHDNGCIGEKPKSNVILNAVGPFSEIIPEIQRVIIEDTDSFLICSDGLSDMLEDSVIEEILYGLKTERIDSYSQNLLEAALLHGGKDNISIVLITQSP